GRPAEGPVTRQRHAKNAQRQEEDQRQSDERQGQPAPATGRGGDRWRSVARAAGRAVGSGIARGRIAGWRSVSAGRARGGEGAGIRRQVILTRRGPGLAARRAVLTGG